MLIFAYAGLIAILSFVIFDVGFLAGIWFTKWTSQDEPVVQARLDPYLPSDHNLN